MNLTNLLNTHPHGNGVLACFPTKSGKLNLSIIAGVGRYSTPQKDVEREEYTHLEVAIFDNTTDDWASLNQVRPILDLFETTGEYHLEENPDIPQIAVFGWIPKDKIEKAWEIL